MYSWSSLICSRVAGWPRISKSSPNRYSARTIGCSFFSSYNIISDSSSAIVKPLQASVLFGTYPRGLVSNIRCRVRAFGEMFSCKCACSEGSRAVRKLVCCVRGYICENSLMVVPPSPLWLTRWSVEEEQGSECSGTAGARTAALVLDTCWRIDHFLQ